MRLWSFQPKEITIPYITDVKNNNCYYKEDFHDAYLYMIEKLNQKTLKPKNCISPVWAWQTQNNKIKKPDMRLMINSYYRKNKDHKIYELEIPDNQVLLSDYDNWHAVLNNYGIPDDEDYDREFTEEEKVKSWDKIFDVENLPYVQAVFWTIKQENIIKIYDV